ncbi:MAG: YcaQ family DNA glycosylase [Myxococcales bacterium]|nr:YcaQ family DNA glycosylase [Myxococcales bacterium]
MPAPTLDELRRYAVARSLFAPTTLTRAVARLGFVQADPLRAPARAQDLILRPRVEGYRAGDLDRRSTRSPIEEDFLINYGYLHRKTQALMHPREPRRPWDEARQERAREVLAFVRERGVVHPREVDARFAHGKIKSWFGGTSNASTELLDGMHYVGLLRVARREGTTRLYAARERAHAPARDGGATFDALLDLVVRTYAPLPASTLMQLARFLCGGVPQWRAHRAAAVQRARARLASAEVEGAIWYWPADERVKASERDDVEERVWLLAPFDPVVWDRARFERFWGWSYRFEAYTPAKDRLRGHYALPLLWRDRVIGWANLAVTGGRLVPDVGFVGARPRSAAFRAALDDELHRMRAFLGLG